VKEFADLHAARRSGAPLPARLHEQWAEAAVAVPAAGMASPRSWFELRPAWKMTAIGSPRLTGLSRNAVSWTVLAHSARESDMGVAKKAKKDAKAVKHKAKKDAGKVKHKGKKAKNAAKH
jgi:hypothetical protein